MTILISLLQIFCAIGIAFLVGKLISKIKLPAILGWLLAGMLLGSHALNLINTTILNTMGYQTAIHILECVVGLMIGTELVWGKIKKSGAQIMITTLTQSLGTFILVTLVFGIIFYFTAIPLYLAAIFGGIALATAPAPALSIVNEFKTDGPVTRALIPMAALDDIVGVVIFFSVIAAVSATLAAQKLPPYMMILVVLFPLVIGIAIGLLDGMLLKRKSVKAATLTLMIGGLLLASGIGLAINILVLPQPLLNFMLIGMAFSATFANIVSRERLAQIMEYFQPLLGFAMIVVILNLGASLDYHLILGAGLFTTVYILTRAAGKYGGAYFGARITHAPDTVRKYLGLTLLPHSGVSLVFTGIAVSMLTIPAPECAKIIQGTIAAAAVINEVIAVIISKKAFEWAGELNQRGKK